MGDQVHIRADPSFHILDNLQAYFAKFVDDCVGSTISFERQLYFTSTSNENSQQILVDGKEHCETSI